MLKLAPNSTREPMKLERTEIYGIVIANVFDLNFQGHVIKLQNSIMKFWVSCTRKHTDAFYFIINVAGSKIQGRGFNPLPA